MAPKLIPEGYELLTGRNGKNARKAIALAKERGFESYSVLTQQEGYLVPLGDSAQPPQVEEIVYPDPNKANHDAIDGFAGEHEVTWEGIEAKDPENPTKAEKVDHIRKTVEARGAESKED